MKQLEQKIQATKKHMQESKKKIENPSLDPKLRQVRKHLRRLQRKRRTLLAREKQLTKKTEPKTAEPKMQEESGKAAAEKAAAEKPAKPASENTESGKPASG